MVSVYEVITDRIIELLEKGSVPWHRPWGGADKHPKNLVSGREYRGINVFMLSAGGYQSPWWLSYKQAKERGGNVKMGERGYPVVYWNWFNTRDDETGKNEKRPFLRYYTLFNVVQCEGIDYPLTRATVQDFAPLEVCERIISEMPKPPRIEHGRERACYESYSDTVRMPPRESFDSPESYYNVLFHELTHSTGHKSRLARPGILEASVFGSQRYSKEELVAEMGAAFLCGHTGIENTVIDNSASYIASWLGRLRNDSRLVVHAAGQAQKATDYILNKKQGGEDEVLNVPEEA